jgi:tetratricopeptide (TPR) repeat protein
MLTRVVADGSVSPKSVRTFAAKLPPLYGDCLQLSLPFAGTSMRDRPKSLIVALAVVLLVPTALRQALATGTELAKEPQVDPAPCLTAISAADDVRITTACGELIDNDKTAKDDRIKALIARAAVFGRRDQIDLAIADYDSALRADASMADVYNARGELWRRKGDRPKALRDFGAAIKLNPDQQAARANYKSLAQELERLGAMMAVAGKPSFNCATARKPVHRAICADPELANLDREINAVNSKVVRDATVESRGAGRARQYEQDEFLARRDASFGRADYDLQKAMRERLDHLLAVERR